MESMTPQDPGLATVFEIFVETALKGERCPSSNPPDYTLDKLCLVKRGTNAPKNAAGELARLGFVRVEISGKNWRTIEILRGEHAGKRTKEDPTGAKPYRILDAKGDRWLKKSRPSKKAEGTEKRVFVDRSSRPAGFRQPWKPGDPRP